MSRYTVRHEGAEEAIEVDSVEEARTEARAWLRGGDWSGVDTSIWVDARLAADHAEIAEGEVCPFCDDPNQERCDGERVTVRIDPAEPRCVDRETSHDWQSPHEIVGGLRENPGVWGHGGGVISREVCVRCGCERTTDTWAQRRDTGEQGLTSVSYEPRKYERMLREKDDA